MSNAVRYVRSFGPLLLCCGSASICLTAHGAECENLPPSSVSVRRLEEPVATNLQYSYQALRGLRGDYTRHDIETLGLTRGLAVAKFSARSIVQPDPTGRWECASHQVSLEYGFSPMTVYVGREFPKGSCVYNEIYAHELKHVRLYQEHARKIQQEIADSLKQRFDTAAPSRGPRGETQQRLSQEINEHWIPYVKRMLEQVDADQRQVDSREEYERVAASCNGAIKKQLRTP